LNYDQDVISISFAALSYNTSSENQYAYKLEGFDDDWVMAGKRREASYTSLPPGEYTFRVKASNNDGKWNEEGIFLKIIILPPFWQTIWFYISCIIVFGLLVFAFIKWREQKLKATNRILEEKVEHRTEKINEQNKVLSLQREELEHKHRDIMDSIKYAKRIQEAILPPSHIVERNINEHFVLYKPKDIVSGDFYWTEEFEGKVMVAAVDCTGHGVPGAFVSIVGSNGLNRAVNEFKLTRPHSILDKLNALVTDSLHQGETEGKDGMDLALCCFDWPKRKIYFSGANNSLYIVSSKLQVEEKGIVQKLNDDRVMYELKADKQPIGGVSSYKQAPFTHHEIEMVQGDMIYLFTDGFADQFGGPKGKKFKYANLFRLLAEISLFPLEKQKEKLNFAFEDWKKDLEQLDDVCVIGIRV
jgi:serine phosphatase RsbU (regulator of sigma subunit)